MTPNLTAGMWKKRNDSQFWAMECLKKEWQRMLGYEVLRKTNDKWGKVDTIENAGK